MAVEDARVRVVEDRRLHAPAEQGLGLAHEELVERVLARHQHRQALAAPAGPAPLLPEAGDRPREPHRDRAVEQADVDPQLERVGGRDAQELALDEPPLDLAALGRRVAGAVRGEPCGRLRVQTLAREAVDQLRRLAALGEADRAQAARRELGQEARALPERAGAELQRLVQHGRVPEDDRARSPRGAVVLDHGGVDPEERARQLARVGDRGRREQELGLGAVDPRGPAQAPEHVPDVRPEDAAVDVRLVHDDVAQVREDVRPAVVVGEDAHVEHVRVGQDRVRPPADLPAALVLGVAVVDRRLHARDVELGERARLVLRQGLRRVEVEGAQLRVGGERVQDGEVEGERLAAGGAGGDDDVLAAPRRLERLRLVREERHRLRGARRAASSFGWSSGSGTVRASRPGTSATWASSSPSRTPSQLTTAIGPMLAFVVRGTPVPHHRHVGLRRGRRDPGGPEGVRRARLPRDERGRGPDRAEHGRGDRRARGAARLRHGPARSGLRGHRRRRRQDRHALQRPHHRGGGGLPRRAPRAARRRPRPGGRLRREAPRGRRGVRPRRGALPPGHRRHPEPARGLRAARDALLGRRRPPGAGRGAARPRARPR